MGKGYMKRSDVSCNALLCSRDHGSVVFYDGWFFVTKIYQSIHLY